MTKPASKRGRPAYADTLTPSEWTVLHLVRHGLTNLQVARARQTSVEAVKYHLRNISEKVGVRGRQQLRQWDGLPASLRAREQERAMTTTDDEASTGPGISGVGQISLAIRDVEQAVSFYRDVLGLPHLFTFGTLAFFDVGGVRLFLGVPEEGREWHEGSVVYYRVPDIHAAHAALTARGVSFESAPHLIHRHESGVEEWMAFFRDPDGNMLGLMAQIQP